MTKLKTSLTIDDRIRERLSRELQAIRKTETEQKVIDEILEGSVCRIEEYLQVITKEIAKQRVTLGHMAELRITRKKTRPPSARNRLPHNQLSRRVFPFGYSVNDQTHPCRR